MCLQKRAILAEDVCWFEESFSMASFLHVCFFSAPCLSDDLSTGRTASMKSADISCFGIWGWPTNHRWISSCKGFAESTKPIKFQDNRSTFYRSLDKTSAFHDYGCRWCSKYLDITKIKCSKMDGSDDLPDHPPKMSNTPSEEIWELRTSHTAFMRSLALPEVRDWKWWPLVTMKTSRIGCVDSMILILSNMEGLNGFNGSCMDYMQGLSQSSNKQVYRILPIYTYIYIDNISYIIFIYHT